MLPGATILSDDEGRKQAGAGLIGTKEPVGAKEKVESLRPNLEKSGRTR